MNRTPLQNKSVHKYFSMLAEALNDAGLDMRKTLEPSVEIPWSPDNIKELMFKPLALAMFNKSSTTELTTKEISEVYECLNRHTSTKLGVGIEWPHEPNKP